MNVIDSSGWLEYFDDGSNADFFAPGIENTAELLVPSICLYEVFKRILQQRSDVDALQAVVAMQQGIVVDLTPALAISAANLSAALKIPMADSIILATARANNALVWTQDADFEGLDGVRYRAK